MFSFRSYIAFEVNVTPKIDRWAVFQSKGKYLENLYYTAYLLENIKFQIFILKKLINSHNMVHIKDSLYRYITYIFHSNSFIIEYFVFKSFFEFLSISLKRNFIWDVFRADNIRNEILFWILMIFIFIFTRYYISI